jgi:hypothetical protein
MKAALVILGSVFAVVVIAVLLIVFSFLGAANFGNTSDKGVTAQVEVNKNTLAQYVQKIQEMAQVPEMYKNDLKEVISAAIGGRYGANGSQATWQWIKEHNPSLDSKIYVKLQETIEAGRTEFQTNQNVLIDKCRQYETILDSYTIRGVMLRFAGFPKIDLKDSCKIVTNDYTDKAFKDHKESGPIQLRPNSGVSSTPLPNDLTTKH